MTGMAASGLARVVDSAVKSLGRLLIGAGLACAAASATLAQDAGILGPGNAVATGFSDTVAYQSPPNDDANAYVTIDTNGPSARVVDLTSVGNWGELSDVPKPLTITAGQVGQVFGVTLDDAPRPNIYLAATSAYGLSIYRPDGTGVVRRLRNGTPGAAFVPGQFGPPQAGGGPGSIWRVDGATGEVVLFATIGEAAFGAASLGGLAYDPASRQIFVASRGTGRVHRLGLDGVERGTYDHGTEGRGPAGLAPAPPPGGPVDINTPAFDTANPFTWGFAQASRRVMALAVHEHRLYYSVAQGPQIWSVGIASNGAVYLNPRIEVDIPSLTDGVEIASIAFDGVGRMYVAERGATTGDFTLTRLANGGYSRVLRFAPKPADFPGPGRWIPEPGQYAVGIAPEYDNAVGGVALGYGYHQGGELNPDGCRAIVWSTGERLLDPGNAEPGTFPVVSGLQGNGNGMIEPDNVPPFKSWIIDYDDRAGSPAGRGAMGAVDIYNPCARVAGPPPVITCPPGTIYSNGQCQVTVNCPNGTYYDPSEGICVYETCPPGYIFSKNQCLPPPVACPPGYFYFEGQCFPVACPPGMFKQPNGYCTCPPGELYLNGKCVPPQACPPGMLELPGGICWCPFDSVFINGKCQPKPCPPGEVKVNGKCQPKPCPQGEIKLPNGQCVPKLCPPGEIKLPNGQCVPGGIVPPCPPGKKWDKGQCVPICKPFEKLVNGKCQPFPIGPKPPVCGPNEHLVFGKCVPFPFQPKPPHCGPDEVLQNNQCVPKPIQPPPPPQCGPDEVLQNNQCVPKPIQPPPPPQCGPDEVLQNNQCVPKPIQPPPPPQCGPDEVLQNNQCVPKPIQPPPPPPQCGPDQVLQNNQCVPKPIRPPPPPPQCGPDEVLQNNQCVPKPIQPPPPPPQCGPDQVLQNNQCVAKPIRPARPPPPQCGPDEQLINGQCVDGSIHVQPVQPVPPDCGPNEEVVNGKCVELQVEQPEQQQQPNRRRQPRQR